MPERAEFRQVGSAGAPALALLWAMANALRAQAVVPDRVDESTVDQLRERLERPGTVAVLGTDDDGPLVGCFATPLERDDGTQPSKWAHGSGVAVRPGRWGTGIGSEALQQLEGALVGAGYRFAQLQVHEDNTRARVFYERHQWRLIRLGDPHPEGPQAVYEKRLT